MQELEEQTEYYSHISSIGSVLGIGHSSVSAKENFIPETTILDFVKQGLIGVALTPPLWGGAPWRKGLGNPRFPRYTMKHERHPK